MGSFFLYGCQTRLGVHGGTSGRPNGESGFEPFPPEYENTAWIITFADHAQ